jgi:hypothetical protein
LDLLVGDLMEIVVPLPDGEIRVRCVQTYDLIVDPLEATNRFCRSHRNGEHQPTWACRSQQTRRRHHRPAGGDAVVDHDHVPACDGSRSVSPTAVADHSASGLLSLNLDLTRQVVLRDLEAFEETLVEYGRALCSHGTQSELRIVRRAHLAHDDHIERTAEPFGHGGGDERSTPRDSQHQWTLETSARETFPQLPSRLESIGERQTSHIPRIPTIGARLALALAGASLVGIASFHERAGVPFQRKGASSGR